MCSNYKEFYKKLPDMTDCHRQLFRNFEFNNEFFFEHRANILAQAQVKQGKKRKKGSKNSLFQTHSEEFCFGSKN